MNVLTFFFHEAEFVYLFLCANDVNNNIQIRIVKIFVKPSDEQILKANYFQN